MALLLASASPRRRELLSWITPDFTVCPSTAPERIPDGCPIEQIAQQLAAAKAADVAARFPEATVIGCDTIVTIDDTVLGKPKDADDCRVMLRRLSGQCHTVYTGVCLHRGTRTECFTASAQVRFYSLTARDIDDYIATGEPFDKAGGYGIQSRGSLLVEEISGDYYAIVGLPVARLKRALAAFETN